MDENSSSPTSTDDDANKRLAMKRVRARNRKRRKRMKRTANVTYTDSEESEGSEHGNVREEAKAGEENSNDSESRQKGPSSGSDRERDRNGSDENNASGAEMAVDNNDLLRGEQEESEHGNVIDEAEGENSHDSEGRQNDTSSGSGDRNSSDENNEIAMEMLVDNNDLLRDEQEIELSSGSERNERDDDTVSTPPSSSDDSDPHLDPDSSEASAGEQERDTSESEASGESSDSESEPENNESSDEDERHNVNNEGDQPIYPGAPISLHESLLSIFTLLTTENISGKLLGVILKLIALHCPDGSLIKKTLHTFKRYFQNIGDSLIIPHYYCSKCIYPVKLKTSVCKHCKKSGSNITFFLELPLEQQLQNLFLREGFYEDLQYRFKPDRKRFEDNIEDIYDGQIYREEVERGFLNNPSSISFMWYSDGVKVFKSSPFSIWPLCMVVNELPYKMRSQPENILLTGLWFGDTKPNPNIFLRPLRKTMQKFETDGHNFKLPDNTVVNVKGKTLCGTCDMPAKCKFMQMKQYNAYCGCPRCMAVGGRVAVNKTTVQIYPYTPNIRLRTHEETQDFAMQALEARRRNKDASVQGVKGPTLLSKIVPDIIRCTSIDIMHGVYLGVCKTLTDLWFSSKFSTMPWSLHHLISVVDEKLSKIKPPSYVQRAPRRLKDLKYWKASEYKLFLLYYSVLVLKGVLEDQYLKHHCLLVSAIGFLSQDSISIAHLQTSSLLLKSYVSDFGRLYPFRFLGINFHQLLHLRDVVFDLGPTWVYSCFFLESYNGVINKCFHGTQHIALQICSAVCMVTQMPNILSQLPIDSKAKKFCLFLKDGSKTFKVADVIDDLHKAVGKYKTDNHDQIDHSMEVLSNTMNVDNGRCDLFFRLHKKGVMYFSEEYGKKSKRHESSYVSFHDNENNVQLGRIVRFVRWSQCRNVCDIDCRNCPATFYAIIRIFRRCHWFIHELSTDIRLPYVFRVERTDNFMAVNVLSIISLCFYFPINNEMYFANPVNRLEVE